MISLFRRFTHLLRSRKSCHGNCLSCPYYSECRADLSSSHKEIDRKVNKYLYERSAP